MGEGPKRKDKETTFMKRFMTLVFFTMLALVVSTLLAGRNAAFAAQRMAVSAEVVLNTFDGSALGDCQAQHEIESGKKHEMWVSFGRVKPQGERGWEAIGSNTHCGCGTFDKGSTLLWRALGLPYVIVDIEMIPAVSSRGGVDLRTTLQIRKLSTFDQKGQPVYAHSEQKRRFDLCTGDYAIVPLLVADPLERDTFNVHELFVRCEARVLGQEVAAYGTISVTADIPGVDILLDGGLVGRTTEKGAIILRNIRVGNHEVRVRDLSGRTKWEQVVVEKDRTVNVNLKLLNLASSSTADLTPIGKNPQGYEEYWRARDGAVVVKVPAGEFLMGSAEGEGEPSEHPQRRVFITEFLMDKTEVTWRQFRKFVEATRTPLPPEPLWGTPSDYAASNVLFNEAKTYCDWAGGRLPTEAEWEKAARGTDGRKYPWGNEWDADRCNSMEGGPHRPENVGSFPDCLSPYGLVDMAGGVWEWCADWYADGYPEGPARDPKGPETGTQRVVRGASWHNMSTWLRTAYRHKSDPFWHNVVYGFRCVQEVPQ
jgi:formylglycine-generating enzyme required for sulfatase activity